MLQLLKDTIPLRYQNMGSQRFMSACPYMEQETPANFA